MSRETRTFALSRPDGPRHVRLALDPAFETQRVMLEYLDAGRLYEQETCTYLAAILRDGDVFVDVGAHVGWFSLFAASLVGPTGQVWSFEPGRANHAQLVDQIALNGYAHVRPVQAAVGSTCGIVTLHVHATHDGGHAVSPDADDAARLPRDFALQPTWCTSLDAFFGDRTLGTVRAMKIDVEGLELEVLRGAQDFLARHQVSAVIAEINHACLERFGTDEHALRAFMDEQGYDTNFFHPTQPMLLPLPPGEVVRSEIVLNYCFVRRTASTSTAEPAT